jgi:hypothetical protein
MDWIELLGGIAVFIYGLQLANDGSQKRAGDQLRRWLTALPEHRLSDRNRSRAHGEKSLPGSADVAYNPGP